MCGIRAVKPQACRLVNEWHNQIAAAAGGGEGLALPRSAPSQVLNPIIKERLSAV